MILEEITAGPIATNCFVVGCPKTKKGCIIDAPPESAEGIKLAIQKHKLEVEAIYFTHSHWDHFADGAKLQRDLKLKCFAHKKAEENLNKPGSDGIPMLASNLSDSPSIEPIQLDGYLDDGDEFSVGEILFQVLYTPGHSPGCIAFYCPKEKILFPGDVLFKGTHGNVSFPQSDPDRLNESLLKLMELEDDVVVCPGHMDHTTIGEERKWICP